jgi:hypothetical protein
MPFKLANPNNEAVPDYDEAVSSPGETVSGKSKNPFDNDLSSDMYTWLIRSFSRSMSLTGL